MWHSQRSTAVSLSRTSPKRALKTERSAYPRSILKNAILVDLDYSYFVIQLTRETCLNIFTGQLNPGLCSIENVVVKENGFIQTEGGICRF